ncbi:MAG TPA: hypothetical protein VEA69_02615 [Tepidisphaeraceae bacterium]|nr:hypothetical protein [Tepidisphaeraceae bacterium]
MTNKQKQQAWRAKDRRRKSTSIISLALVPLGLLGLGYVGCDKNNEEPPQVASAEGLPGDFTGEVDPAEPITTPMFGTPLPEDGTVPPITTTTTTTLIDPDGKAYDPTRTYAATPVVQWERSTFLPVFVPVPVWSVPTYRPRALAGSTTSNSQQRYVRSSSGSRTFIPIFWSGSSWTRTAPYRPGYSSSGYRTGPSGSSGYRSGSSSGTSRGGFGSSSGSYSSSSSS